MCQELFAKKSIFIPLNQRECHVFATTFKGFPEKIEFSFYRQFDLLPIRPRISEN